MRGATGTFNWNETIKGAGGKLVLRFAVEQGKGAKLFKQNSAT